LKDPRAGPFSTRQVLVLIVLGQLEQSPFRSSFCILSGFWPSSFPFCGIIAILCDEIPKRMPHVALLFYVSHHPAELPESLCPFCHTLSSIRVCATHEKHEEELLGWTISLTVVGK
jgi:hypothetical protein